MALEHQDLLLTDEQLARINDYAAERGAAYARAGEGPPMGGLRLEISWTPGLGRSISAYFDGAVNGCIIEAW